MDDSPPIPTPPPDVDVDTDVDQLDHGVNIDLDAAAFDAAALDDASAPPMPDHIPPQIETAARSSGFSKSKSNSKKRGRGKGDERPAPDPRELSRLIQQLPPSDFEAEMSLLGSILIDPKACGDVMLILRGGHEFAKPANGLLYDIMIELYDKLDALDVVQLHSVLKDRDQLSTIGGLDYLVELASAVPSAANAVHYARIVREKSELRVLIETAGEILFDAHNSSDSSRDILEAAEQKIFKVASEAEQTHAESMKDLVMEVLRIVEESDGRMLSGVPSGFADLDEMTHGLQRGEMVILAARPSMGKTAFALNVAEQMALAGHAVAVFSLEMGKQALVQRLLSARSGVDSARMRRGMLGREEWDRLHNACDELHQAPIFIDDTPGLTMLQLRAKARRLKSRHDVEVVLIDYLQLMSSGRRAESRQVEISEISRGVKAMARELDVPVICLSQLNRAAEQREGHRPRMSDLRESGSIEQDADVVAMLHREEYYHVGDEDWAIHNEDKVGLAELIIAKQRNGPTGTVKLTWSSSTTRFLDFSHRQPPDDYSAYVDQSAVAPVPAPQSSPAHSGFQPPGGAGNSPAGGGSHFSPGRSTGPVADFRDGGGPTDMDDGDTDDIDGIPI